MTQKEKNALANFMINTVAILYPDRNEYPLKEMKNIEETEGDESKSWDNYPDYVRRAYWMIRDIEIITGNSIIY